MLPGEPVEKEMLLVETESNEKECCVCKEGSSVMYRKHMRLHVAGHAWTGKGESLIKKVGGSYSFGHPCGFCGVPDEVGGCTIDIKTSTGKRGTKRVVVSSCGLKLDGMKFSDMDEKRAKELKERLEAGGKGEAVVVKLRGFPVVNIPVECPVPDCAKVVWKYNLMPHVCDAHINLYGERNQRWRKRAKPLVAEFVEKLCAVGGRTFGGGKGKKCHKLTNETVEAVGVLLEEMKELVPGDLGIKLAFNMEELARESDSALDAFENYKGPLPHRAKWSRKEKGSGNKKGAGQQTNKTIGRDEEVGGGGVGEANEQDEVEEEEGSDNMSISSDEEEPDAREEQEREEEVVVLEDESSDSDDSQRSEQARRKVGKRKRKK
jgi:hypothetical protein